MSFKKSLGLWMVLGLSVISHAQTSEEVKPVQIRAVLHDPVHPSANLFFEDAAGKIVSLEFLPQELTRMQLMRPVNDSLVFYDKAEVDTKKPEASLAATCKIPAGLKRGIVIVLPNAAGIKPAYRLLLIDDSAVAFAKGESRVLSLIAVETAIQAGEHRIPIHPGDFAKVPPVKKVNEYNMAQTNFYYKKDEAWLVFTERQLQYLDAYRRIFIVHARLGAMQPTVLTIVDNAPL